MTGIIRYFNCLLFSPHRQLMWRLPSLLGFLPGHPAYYILAFIHKSTSKTDPGGLPRNNERLEFLGDAILGSVIGEYLYKTYPDQKEGFLTKMRSKIVNGERLGELAMELKLDELLQTQVSGKSSLKHLSGDAFEALIGAIYLDKGYGAAKRFLLRKIIDRHLDLMQLEREESNYKSILIEWAQKGHKDICFYTDVEPYDPTRFISYVSIGDTLFGSGTGGSKKEAEQEAALETLKELSATSHDPILQKVPAATPTV